jgi:hypothetical protein
LLLCACTSIRDTRFSRVLPLPDPEPLRVAVLPPQVAEGLRAGQLQGEGRWYETLAAGRGMTVTSATPEQDIALALVSTLSLGRAFHRVFLAADATEAARLGADRLLRVSVHDYRTVLRGANARYSLVMLLGPLLPQYWVRWLTFEARLDWEAELVPLDGGPPTFRRRLERRYYLTARYALGPGLADKMLNFLRTDATNEFIGECFLLHLVERDAPPPAAVPPHPSPAPATGDGAAG